MHPLRFFKISFGHRKSRPWGGLVVNESELLRQITLPPRAACLLSTPVAKATSPAIPAGRTVCPGALSQAQRREVFLVPCNSPIWMRA